jgi:hypothetical protein
MTKQEDEELEEFVQQLQIRFGVTFPKGVNQQAHFMKHMWEDLRVAFKPLFVHVLFELANLSGQVLLLLSGFRKYRTPAFSYWGRNLDTLVRCRTRTVADMSILLRRALQREPLAVACTAWF